MSLTIGTVSGVVSAVGLYAEMPMSAVIVGSVINGATFFGYQIFIDPYSKWLGDDGWLRFKNRNVEKFALYKQSLKRGIIIASTILAYQLGLAAVGALPVDLAMGKTLLFTTGKTIATGLPWGAVFGNLGAGTGRQPKSKIMNKIYNATTVNIVVSAAYALATTFSVAGQESAASFTYGAITASGIALWAWQSFSIAKMREVFLRTGFRRNQCSEFEINNAKNDYRSSYK